MQWDFVVLIWVQTNGSPWSPGNDLCGLNDDSVSSTEEKKGVQQHRAEKADV